MTKYLKLRILLIAVAVGLFAFGQLNAQYFGQNKPRYRSFDFKVMETPNFEIFYYTKDRDFLIDIANQAEQWYEMHLSVLQDTIEFKNPLIFYNNHADFQQTNAIYGNVGIGTGGVTEGFKNRVVLPFTFTHQQTSHVLGHELVHAFQYDMIIGGDSTNIQSLGNIPLWMIEGLAEYLSIGRLDPHTAMWMRDAVLNDNVPSIKDLNNPKFFPYRYGQVFWTIVTGMYGDDVISPLFKMTGMYGLSVASKSVLGVSIDSLSNIYQESIKDYYSTFLGDKKERFIGKEIISDENAGRMNISPVMSPNGRYVIFLSEKNIFSTDLYLADARSGKIIKKITSILKDDHLDDLNFLESAGTWSPDSKRFAFIGFEKGRNVIVIKEAQTGKTLESVVVKGVAALSNPSWSPNGREIVVSGLVEGQTDLYSYTVKTGRVKQLTDNRFSEIQPTWNAEGTKIAFATDQLSLEEGRHHGKWLMNLALLDVGTGETEQIDVFRKADNMNPAFDPEGNLYFLSDRDGYRNIYKYHVHSDSVFQMTDFLVGVSGITRYSPAISSSRNRDRIVFSHYHNGSYAIYQASGKQLLNKPVPQDAVAMAPGMLPIVGNQVKNTLQENFKTMNDRKLLASTEFKNAKYVPRFKLDYASGAAGIGVGTGTYGTRTASGGGVNLIFSDMLGNNMLLTSLSMNGEVLDFGGGIQYLNRKNRIAWGGSISHFPMRAGSISLPYRDTLELNGGLLPVLREDVNILRIFEDRFSLLAHLPFSKKLRWEASAGLNYMFFRYDQYPNYYTSEPPYYYRGQGNREQIKIDADEFFVGNFLVKKGAFYNFTTALVGDNTRFGLTSPLNGYRYRLEVAKYIGTYDYYSTTADGRVYQYIKPFSLAFRIQHFARHGVDADSFSPILIGWMGLVRGYDYNQIIKRVNLNDEGGSDDVTFKNQLNTEFARLSGSKFILSSFEIRMPFSGPERLALIKTGFLFSDLSAFLDAGVAFDKFSHFSDGEPIEVQNLDGPGTQILLAKPELALSAGFSLRVNFFGALILEPYVAWPLRGPGSGRAILGLNFVPGW